MIKPHNTNAEFELGGINYVALVCSDMARTVDFYPDRLPGVSSPAAIPGIGEITSAVSTMNHLAFHVPADKFDAYRQRLKDKGVRVGPILNHDESEMQVSATVHPGVYVRSFYFQDPDSVTLEFACWAKESMTLTCRRCQDRSRSSNTGTPLAVCY